MAVALAIGGCSHARERKRPIPVATVERVGVEGRLGFRMGTIVTVEGDVVSNPTYASKDVNGDYEVLLRIIRVDGRPLAKALDYPFIRANDWVKTPDPAAGQRFRYVGYETGAFAGSPSGEFEYVPSRQTVGYFFQTQFLVLAAG